MVLLRRLAPPLAPSPRATHVEKLGGRTKLRPRHAADFERHPPGLFRDVALVVCELGSMPRKELYECWQVAERVNEHFPEARCVADLAAGHGLLAWLLLLLGQSGGASRRVTSVDRKMPPSAEALSAAFSARWPELADSHAYVEGDLARVEPSEDTLLTALHACGPLTDAVLALSVRSRCSAAVVPCCHSLRKYAPPPSLGLDMSTLRASAAAVGPVATIDGCRLKLLSLHDYDVRTTHVDSRITPYNKLILARPRAETAGTNARVPPPPEPPELLAAAWSKRSGEPLPPPIRVSDASAIRAIAGRRVVSSRRAIEVSMWMDKEGAVDERALGCLARRAALAPDWDASGEAAAVFDETKGVEQAAAVGATETADDAAPAVSVEMCDAYTDPSSGRQARSFRIVFSSSEEWKKQISRQESTAWQRRIRQALEARSARVGIELR